MKKRITFLLITIPFFLSLISLNAQNMKMRITIRDKNFTALLENSNAAEELVKLLPMEILMNEHNGNEKFFNLSKSISGKASIPRKIEPGEIMIWGSNTLVLFYESLYPSYSYIRIGKIDDIEGLSKAVGRGRVRVKFELVKESKPVKENDTVIR